MICWQALRWKISPPHVRLDPYLLRTVFEYLTVEDVLVKAVIEDKVTFRLSAYGSRMKHYEGWFNILIGGYDNIFSHIAPMHAGRHRRL